MQVAKLCGNMGTTVGFSFNHVHHCSCPSIVAPDETYVTHTFHGGKFPLKNYLASLSRLISANSGDCPICQGCVLLNETPEFNPWKGYFRDVNVTTNTACNFRCSYCLAKSVTYEAAPETIKYDLAFTLLDMCNEGLIKPGLTTIHWGGGEPSICKHFEKCCEILTDNDIVQMINTNAGVFSRSIAKAIKSHVKTTVRISIDAGSRAVFKKIRGVDRLEDVWQNVKKYAELNPEKIMVKYIVMPENSAEIELRAFVEKCVSVGIKYVGVMPEYASFWRGEYTNREFYAMGTLKRMCKQAGINVMLEDVQFTMSQKHFMEGVDYAIDRVIELENEVKAYENSTSWRVTKPIRAVKKLLSGG